MNVLVRGTWTGEFLDAHLPEDHVRVSVAGYLRLERLRTLYFEAGTDVRRVWNYVREVGVGPVLARVRSRRAERGRNDAYVAVGLGSLVEDGSDASPARPVWFVAPAHPAGAERLVLRTEFVRVVHDGAWGARALEHQGAPLIFDGESAPTDTARFEDGEFAGWSPHSGLPVPEAAAAALLDQVPALLEQHWGRPEGVSGWTGASAVQEQRAATGTSTEAAVGTRLPATVFGYGHYAKISILPNLDERIQVQRVHEIDPIQLGPGPHPYAVDSAPGFRPDDSAKVAFLAGFHHTHAPLATEALSRGAHAVIEKPLATTHDQLDGLLGAARASEATVHVGFHKRHQPFNDWAREDLGADLQEPISYYCIAYEVPLPASHWYRWPNSGSRLLSNGCHWVDHFLFLNNFVKVRDLDVAPFASGDVSVRIELENGAGFHMVLTDQGGARIGVQDHIELRAGNRTARIVNASSYRAEDDRRILRKKHENKTLAYGRMYRTISTRIAEGDPGESLTALERSARTVLELEDRIQRARARKSVRIDP